MQNTENDIYCNRFQNQFQEFMIGDSKYATTLIAINNKITNSESSMPKFESNEEYKNWLDENMVTDKEKQLWTDEPGLKQLEKASLFHRFVKRLLIPNFSPKSVLCSHICAECRAFISLSKNRKTFKASNGLSHIRNHHTQDFESFVMKDAQKHKRIDVEKNKIIEKTQNQPVATSSLKRSHVSDPMGQIYIDLILYLSKNRSLGTTREDTTLTGILQLASTLKSSDLEYADRFAFAHRRDQIVVACIWKIRKIIDRCRKFHNDAVQKSTTQRCLSILLDGWSDDKYGTGYSICVRLLDPMTFDMENLSLGILHLPKSHSETLGNNIAKFFFPFNISPSDVLMCLCANETVASTDFVTSQTNMECSMRLGKMLIRNGLGLCDDENENKRAYSFEILTFMRELFLQVMGSRESCESYQAMTSELKPTCIHAHLTNDDCSVHTMASSILQNFHCLRKFLGDYNSETMDRNYELVAQYESLLRPVVDFIHDVQKVNTPICGFSIYFKARLRYRIRSNIRSTVNLSSGAIWKGDESIKSLPRHMVMYDETSTAHDSAKTLFKLLNSSFNHYFENDGRESVRNICRDVLGEDDVAISARFMKHFGDNEQPVLKCSVVELLALVLDPLMKCIICSIGSFDETTTGKDLAFLWDIAEDVLKVTYSNMRQSKSMQTTPISSKQKTSVYNGNENSDFETKLSNKETTRKDGNVDSNKFELQKWLDLEIKPEDFSEFYPDLDPSEYTLKGKVWEKVNSLKYFSSTTAYEKFPIIRLLALRYVAAPISNSLQGVLSKEPSRCEALRNHWTTVRYHKKVLLNRNAHLLEFSTPNGIDSALKQIKASNDIKKISIKTIHEMCRPCPNGSYDDADGDSDDEIREETFESMKLDKSYEVDLSRPRKKLK